MLAPEAPYPLAGGGALRTASLLHYLAQAHDVDLIVFRQPGAPHPAEHMPPGLVRHLAVIDLPANSRTQTARAFRNAGRLARRIPPLVETAFSGFGAQIVAAIKNRRYEIGVIEHFWCAPYYPQNLLAACAGTVLDLHNIESDLHARCAATEKPGRRFSPTASSRALRAISNATGCRENFTHVLVPAELGHALACPVSKFIPMASCPHSHYPPKLSHALGVLRKHGVFTRIVRPCDSSATGDLAAASRAPPRSGLASGREKLLMLCAPSPLAIRASKSPVRSTMRYGELAKAEVAVVPLPSPEAAPG